jgi:hypothetical protein
MNLEKKITNGQWPYKIFAQAVQQKQITCLKEKSRLLFWKGKTNY